MLTVTNRNNFDFEGRYNSHDYQFPAGKTTAVSDEAARHIFGIGLKDKTDVLVRHGWMTHSSHQGAAMAKLNGFAFNVSNELQDGQVIEAPAVVALSSPSESVSVPTEQGSAPLQPEAGEEESSSEPTESPVATSQYGGSILDRLSGS